MGKVAAIILWMTGQPWCGGLDERASRAGSIPACPPIFQNHLTYTDPVIIKLENKMRWRGDEPISPQHRLFEKTSIYVRALNSGSKL